MPKGTLRSKKGRICLADKCDLFRGAEDRTRKTAKGGGAAIVGRAEKKEQREKKGRPDRVTNSASERSAELTYIKDGRVNT